MNSCIITGATGYIGSHVLKYLLAKGWDIHIIADPKFGYSNIEDVLDRLDIFEYNGCINSLIDFFSSVNVDVVFHLAAAVISNCKPEQVPILIQSNIQFGTEILEAMKASKTRKIISTGSYWQNYEGDEYSPVDLYAATKEAFEKIVQLYVEADGFNHINLRLYDIYGEDDRRPKLWNLLRDIAGTERSVDISPGEQLLDMVHISDVCTAYEAAYNLMMQSREHEAVYSVRTGSMHSLRELIYLFQSAIGKDIHVNIGAKKYKDREVMHPTSFYPILPNWHAVVSIIDGFNKFNI